MAAHAGAVNADTGAMMPDLKTTNSGHARIAARKHKVAGNRETTVSGDYWHWINGIADSISNFFSGTLTNFAKVVLNHFENLVDAYREAMDTILKLTFWVDRLIWHVVKGWIDRLRAEMKARMDKSSKYLLRLIFITSNAVMSAALRWVRAERKQRIRDVSRARAQARAEIRAMHHTIEREASSGYRAGQDDRISLIVRLLDFAVVRNPELRFVTREIIRGALDLLSVDDPVARLLLGFLVNHVIDALGIDKMVGTAVRDMLAPLLGQPKPHDIHDVVMDMSKRMLNSEAQWTQFYTNGGSEVEQAGDLWRDITGPLGTAAIVAFTVQAVADPERWAHEISDTVGVAANDVLSKAAEIFKGA